MGRCFLCGTLCVFAGDLSLEKASEGSFETKRGLCHAWPTFTFLPETRRTLREMKDFFKKENVE